MCAVTFLPAGQELPRRDYHYRKLDARELAEILRELPKRPLLAGEKGILRRHFFRVNYRKPIRNQCGLCMSVVTGKAVVTAAFPGVMVIS